MTALSTHLFKTGNEMSNAGSQKKKSPKLPLLGPEEIMSKKAHGTTDRPVQDSLRYGVDRSTADRICCFNRHYAEHSGYFKSKKWIPAIRGKGEVTYYDSVTGKPLFVAPRGRTLDAFLQESAAHGWPSFRDNEVVWENVRCLKNGEAVSLAGTHLGHNLPDKKGNRYCINLCCIAGNPVEEPAPAEAAAAASATEPAAAATDGAAASAADTTL